MNKKCEPAAWLVDGGEYQYVSLFRESADAAANEEGGAVTPLYRSPTLTDAERRAVGYFAALTVSPRQDDSSQAAVLRGLLERMSPQS